MDRNAAITSFMEHIESLSGLPFITDLEIKEIYGQEVASALEGLERISQEEQICQQCDINCCREHGCELYAPQFNRCPVHDFRPAICRFHFCQKFQNSGRPFIEELSEIFLYSLSTAAANGSDRVKFFNPPPFAEVVPELIEIIGPLVKGVRSGSIEPGYCRRRILEEVLKYNKLKINEDK